MTSTAGGTGAAFDASVSTDPVPAAKQKAYRQALADDAERAVEVIQAKHDGIKASLADAKSEAKRLRSEVEGA